MPLKFFKNLFRHEEAKKIEVPDRVILNNDNGKKLISSRTYKDVVNEVKNELKENTFNINYNQENHEQLSKNSVEQILTKNFPKGYRKNSIINREKFKKHWENTYGSPIDIEDNSIDEYINDIGIVYNDIIYSPQTMMNEATKEKIISYIDTNINLGKPVIYYGSLFKKFENELSDSDSNVFNGEMLREYLKYVNQGKYNIHKDYITSKKTYSADNPLYTSIKEYLKQTAVPVSLTQLAEEFPDIPKDSIKKILNRYSEFVYNNNDEYFHIDTMLISDDELSYISGIIKKFIDEHGFLEMEELVRIIRDKYPSILDQNSLITSTGLRNTLSYKFKKEFSFKGNIISNSKSEMSMSKIFIDFCKNNKCFTLEQLKSINDNIYFNLVYKYSIRINKNDFISKSQISFDIEEIDKIIDKFCIGDYIPIKSIESFAFFPNVGITWNSFLLEQYVAQYSEKYKLIHSGYSKTKCAGAIVKKTSSINNFDDLIINVISKSNVKFEKNTVLKYLVDNGYIARKSYDKMDYALIKAKEFYNRSKRS